MSNNTENHKEATANSILLHMEILDNKKACYKTVWYSVFCVPHQISQIAYHERDFQKECMW